MFYLFDKALFFNDLRIDARAGAKPPPSQKHAYTIRKKCFLPHFNSGAGGRVNPKTPKKHFFCVRHAEGMRKHGANRTEAIA
jgi:hypothetical protein